MANELALVPCARENRFDGGYMWRDALILIIIMRKTFLYAVCIGYV